MSQPPLRGFFVTGTDTGVGKTTLAVGLLRAALRRGLRPIPFKPVETGCAPRAEDAHALWHAARPPIAEDDVCLHALRLPAAPAEAALAEGVSLSIEAMVERARWLAQLGDFLVVEGAGGLLVPYGPDATAADLAVQLGLPLLVIGRTALGTLNHTALTVREASRNGLGIMGIILNQINELRAPHETGPHADSNDRWLAALTGRHILGTVPHLPAGARTNPDHLADVITASLGEANLSELLSPT